MGRARTSPHCEPQPPIPGTCFGGRRVRRAGARQSGDRGRHAAQGALSSAGVRLERLLHRRPYRLRPRLVERGAVRSAGRFDHRQRLQRRDRRRAGRLQCADAVRPGARRRGRPDVSELFQLELDRLHARRRALRSRREMGLCRHRARPHWLCQRTLAALRHRRLRLCRRALHQYARRRHRPETDQRPPRLGRRRRRGIRLRAALERQARIPLQPVRSRQYSLPLGRGAQFHPRLPADPYRPQPQGRLAGIEQPLPEVRPDRSRIRPLGNPRPEHLSGTGLSGLSRALYRHQQPDACAAGAGHLEQQPLPQRPPLGRRRGLLQSRTAAGIWFERYRRRRRIYQRRGAEVELPLSALQHLAAVCAPDIRIRRRAGGACQRAATARGQGRHIAADAAGRQVLGRRRL